VTQIAGNVATQTLQQVTTNLSLQVTPLVAGDGSIFLSITIHNDIPAGSGQQTTVNGRNINTQVLIENGDTAVVGGIFSDTAHNTRAGIPILMHVPVIGYLFSQNHRDDNRNELFVFLTAKILNAEESFKRTF
jgi:type IV pilus assembly protein PilQ